MHHRTSNQASVAGDDTDSWDCQPDRSNLKDLGFAVRLHGLVEPLLKALRRHTRVHWLAVDQLCSRTVHGATVNLWRTLMSGTSHTEQLRWPDVGSTCLHLKSLPCRPFFIMSRSTIIEKSIFAVTYRTLREKF